METISKVKIKPKRIIKWSLFIVLTLCGAYLAWLLLLPSNCMNHRTVGDIPTPIGYHRVENSPKAEFFRSLELQPRGHGVKYLNSGKPQRLLNRLSYATLALPPLTKKEDCADVAVHLNGEYRYSRGIYSSRKGFEKQMRRQFVDSNTGTLYQQLPTRQIKDLQIGDVLVITKEQLGGKMGHIVTIGDIAVNPRNGTKKVILIEGNFPGVTPHVIKNVFNPLQSPWFTIGEDDERILTSTCWYPKEGVKYFN